MTRVSRAVQLVHGDMPPVGGHVYAGQELRPSDKLRWRQNAWRREVLATGKGTLTASPWTLPERADAHHTCMITRHECKEVKHQCQ